MKVDVAGHLRSTSLAVPRRYPPPLRDEPLGSGIPRLAHPGPPEKLRRACYALEAACGQKVRRERQPFGARPTAEGRPENQGGLFPVRRKTAQGSMSAPRITTLRLSETPVGWSRMHALSDCPLRYAVPALPWLGPIAIT